MADVVIEREEFPHGGRYVVHLEGREAELTYRVAGDDVIAADHTFVPHEMRGGGIALKLVERLITDARAEGRRIRPLCSYVAAQFQRHPEWADLKAN
jgi:predicted GNAT family acetyltransferase